MHPNRYSSAWNTLFLSLFVCIVQKGPKSTAVDIICQEEQKPLVELEKCRKLADNICVMVENKPTTRIRLPNNLPYTVKPQDKNRTSLVVCIEGSVSTTIVELVTKIQPLLFNERLYEIFVDQQTS